jgi:hypothetical protein
VRLKFNPDAQWQPHPTEDILELTRTMFPHEQLAADRAATTKEEKANQQNEAKQQRTKSAKNTEAAAAADDFSLPAPQLSLFRHLLR